MIIFVIYLWNFTFGIQHFDVTALKNNERIFVCEREACQELSFEKGN